MCRLSFILFYLTKTQNIFIDIVYLTKTRKKEVPSTDGELSVVVKETLF